MSLCKIFLVAPNTGLVFQDKKNVNSMGLDMERKGPGPYSANSFNRNTHNAEEYSLQLLGVGGANELNFNNWTLSSYSESLRLVTNLVERRWTSSSSLISFFSHGRQAWNEYCKWGPINAPYNLWKSAGVISMKDAFIALIIEFAF